MDVSLVRKGDESTFDSKVFENKQTLIVMDWKTEVDLDLAVVYQAKPQYQENGPFGILYYGSNQGERDPNQFPFLEIGDDEGVGDTADEGGNEEFVAIHSLEGIEFLWILAWDYGGIEKKQAARLETSQITIKNQDGVIAKIEMADSEFNMSNVMCYGVIDNTGEKPRLIKVAQGSLLKRFQNLSDILNGILPNGVSKHGNELVPFNPAELRDYFG